MSTIPAPANTAEALNLVLTGLRYLAAADPAAMAVQAQAECLQALEHSDAIATAARARILAAFTAGQGYAADADYSRTSWLIHPGYGYPVELLHRPGSAFVARGKPDNPAEAALRHGYGHVAFDVTDLDAAYDRAVARGARPVMAPCPSPEPGVRMAFVTDPEGNLVELLHRPAPAGSDTRSAAVLTGTISQVARPPHGVDHGAPSGRPKVPVTWKPKCW